MARNERRRSMPLDEAYFYCRRLELKLERPALFKVCNAIRTIDLALDDTENPGFSSHISAEAWSRIRDQLFKILISSFAGYFLVYENGSSEPLEDGRPWPEQGHIEFYPEKILRRFETYQCDFSRLDPSIMTLLRWSYSQERHNISPSLFNTEAELEPESESAQDEALAFLDRMYEICEEEASEGKKKAHRKWWQLYWEANGCPDRRARHELQKKMLSLQSVWGRPAQLV
ncbi:MAG: hypothetical protein K2X27_21665 [Candidatus Obscuribacterales bacterium]|nr:hypothetical protein [Candidatus Obscuribacterales bacterium]